MSFKFSLYLLIYLIYLSNESQNQIYELEQYGHVTVYDGNYLYLSLDGFDKGSKVYIKLEINYRNYFYSKMSIDYRQSNTYNKNDFEYYTA